VRDALVAEQADLVDLVGRDLGGRGARDPLEPVLELGFERLARALVDERRRGRGDEDGGQGEEDDDQRRALQDVVLPPISPGSGTGSGARAAFRGPPGSSRGLDPDRVAERTARPSEGHHASCAGPFGGRAPAASAVEMVG
jgi:hypothetical protein